jgi:glycosyltransferase involved in cell wall biosynthesis
MRIVINAQLDPKVSGGIAQVLVGLAHGLGKLSGAEEYLFVCSAASASWLRPHLGGNCRIEVDRGSGLPSPRRGARRSDGFFESFDPDVIHFPYQAYTVTDVPAVFNPHDLQHVYFPEFFEGEECERREALYAEACGHARAVVVASRFVKQDVVSRYGVAADNVHVISWGPPTQAYARSDAAQVQAVRAKFRLPEMFAIYPAQLWPHKNHKRLLESLAWLRDHESLRVPLVCTGADTKYRRQIEQAMIALGLSGQVWLVGRVDEAELMALYSMARMMVVPTLFEAISFPILEAFAEGIPVACSDIGALPEQVGDAALLFDPLVIGAMASSIGRMYRDGDLREALVRRGACRLSSFTWEATARCYRDLYRKVAALGVHDSNELAPVVS